MFDIYKIESNNETLYPNLYPVGPPDLPPIRTLCSGILPNITPKPKDLKTLAVEGNWAKFQAAGGTFEQFKSLRDKYAWPTNP